MLVKGRFVMENKRISFKDLTKSIECLLKEHQIGDMQIQEIPSVLESIEKHPEHMKSYIEFEPELDEIIYENEDGDVWWCETKHFETQDEFMDALKKHLVESQIVSEKEFEDSVECYGIKMMGSSPADDGYSSWVDITEDGLQIKPYWNAGM